VIPWSRRFFAILLFEILAHGAGNYFMDSAQHCIDQSAECRRLVKLAQSEVEAQALKNLSRSWTGLAGQIDRYNALIREHGRRVVGK
jgi:hypothetical protein